MTPPRKRTAAPPATSSGGAGAAPGPYDETEQPEHTPIDARQMRTLHALLAAHGINGDVTRHDYLGTEVGRTITTASELTKVEGARLIAELEAADAPEVHTPSSRTLAKLRADFKPEEVGKLPRSLCRNCSTKQGEHPNGSGTCPEHRHKAKCSICGNYHNTQATMHIDFVGHADVTARLLEVDPTWTWRPFTAEEIAGVPPALREGGLWIMLTVCGVTRPGFGEGSSGQQVGGDQVKVAIGDALRNAGMRFGVALQLWAKGDREWANAEKHGAEHMPPDAPGPRQDTPEPEWTGPDTDTLIGDLRALAGRSGTDLDGITAKFREQHGNLTVDQLVNVPPRVLLAFREQARTYIEEQEAKAAADPLHSGREENEAAAVGA